MRITSNSSFYKLPNNLSPNERLLLEAIRYSVNMCFTAWQELKITLLNISQNSTFEKEKYDAFLHAWAIIDNLDRIKSIFSQIEIIDFGDFRISTKNVREMRNTYHHIYDRINTSLNVNFPLLGTLDWTYYSDNHENNSLFIFKIASGQHVDFREYELLNPLGKNIEIPIGMITLTSVIKNPTSKIKADLSEMMNTLESTILKLEKHLEMEFRKLNFNSDYVQQDFLMSLKFE